MKQGFNVKDKTIQLFRKNGGSLWESSTKQRILRFGSQTQFQESHHIYLCLKSLLHINQVQKYLYFFLKGKKKKEKSILSKSHTRWNRTKWLRWEMHFLLNHQHVSRVYVKPFLIRSPCTEFYAVTSQAVVEHLTGYDTLFAQYSMQDFLMDADRVAISERLSIQPF